LKKPFIKTLLIYGTSLAMLAWVLQLVQFKYQVRVLPVEWYVVIIAVFFTALGIWAGHRMTGRNPQAEFKPNEKARAYLGITDRELEVLTLLAQGHTNKQIAEQIFVSGNTVKTHVSHLYDKLEVSRRTQAVMKAKELHLIP